MFCVISTCFRRLACSAVLIAFMLIPAISVLPQRTMADEAASVVANDLSQQQVVQQQAVIGEEKAADDQAKVPPGINKEFLSPDLEPEEWIKRFEVESREVFAGRNAILKAIGLKEGQFIADVGSGTGLYLGPFSESVAEKGKVYAVDISPKLIAHIQRRVKADKMSNVEVIQSQEKSAMLPTACVDVVFVCDTYHHFEFYEEMLDSIVQALKPGGQLVIIDFNRIPGKSREWLLTHVRASKETVLAEVTAAGLEFVEEVKIPEFEENYFLRFSKPDHSQ